jgi:hypothetical protein
VNYAATANALTATTMASCYYFDRGIRNANAKLREIHGCRRPKDRAASSENLLSGSVDAEAGV